MQKDPSPLEAPGPVTGVKVEVVDGDALPVDTLYRKVKLPLGAEESRRRGRDTVSVYVAVTAVAKQDQIGAINAARTKFESLSESALYALAHDEQPVGWRLGIKDMPEPTAKALAAFHLEKKRRHGDRRWHVLTLVLGAGLGAVVTYFLGP